MKTWPQKRSPRNNCWKELPSLKTLDATHDSENLNAKQMWREIGLDQDSCALRSDGVEEQTDETVL